MKAIFMFLVDSTKMQFEFELMQNISRASSHVNWPKLVHKPQSHRVIVSTKLKFPSETSKRWKINLSQDDFILLRFKMIHNFLKSCLKLFQWCFLMIISSQVAKIVKLSTSFKIILKIRALKSILNFHRT